MRQTGQPASATTPAISGSPRSAVTSLTIAAPAASARRATSALEVSTEIRAATLPCKRLDDGHDAAGLLLDRDRVGARPRRLAADVDDRRALGGHGHALADRRLGVHEEAPVRERVGGHVEDPHDAGEGEVGGQTEGAGHERGLSRR